jgi:UPF0755 protein
VKGGAIAAAVAGIAGLAIGLAVLIASRPVPRFARPRIVSIRRGESFISAARNLKRTGVIRSAGLLLLYGEWERLATRIKPGDYAFEGGESLETVMLRLVMGDFMTVVVTIPEGLTIHEIGTRLEQAGLTCQGEFDEAAANGPITRAIGLDAMGAEGFLFPATYRFSPRARTNEVLAAMLERFYLLLTPAVEERMFELGIDIRQLVTLASIIEKEAKLPAERRLIASVFYNRLAAGMPLQSDPTAQYNSAGEQAPAATAVHTASAFNTYTILGLPPGPIANPGLSSIEAALYPANTDYLYFVARNDGTHVFSRSFEAHRRAVAERRRRIGPANHPELHASDSLKWSTRSN